MEVKVSKGLVVLQMPRLRGLKILKLVILDNLIWPAHSENMASFGSKAVKKLTLLFIHVHWGLVISTRLYLKCTIMSTVLSYSLSIFST